MSYKADTRSAAVCYPHLKQHNTDRFRKLKFLNCSLRSAILVELEGPSTTLAHNPASLHPVVDVDTVHFTVHYHIGISPIANRRLRLQIMLAQVKSVPDYNSRL
jgi:hypothetical protein